MDILKIKSLVVIGIATILSSCSSQMTYVTEVDESNSAIVVNTPPTLIKPIIADLDISQESKSATYETELNLSNKEYMANARFQFMSEHKCDLIIDPRYSKTTTLLNNSITKTSVAIKGFPATYKKLYQEDTVDESVYRYNQMVANVDRDEFLQTVSKQGSGREMSLSLNYGTYIGSELNVQLIENSPIYSYISYETGYGGTYFSSGNTERASVSFDLTEGSLSNRVEDMPLSMSTFSVGAGARQNINYGMKASGFIGLNVANISLSTPIVGFPNSYRIEGFTSYGLRAGIELEKQILSGLSICAKTFFMTQNRSTPRASQTGFGFGVSNFEYNNANTLNYALGLSIAL